MSNSIDVHWIAIKRIFRYRSGTLHHSILLRKTPNFDVVKINMTERVKEEAWCS